MSLNAAAIEILIAKGLSGDDLLGVARALEVGKPRSTGAERQARYREKKRHSVTSGVTDDVTSDVTRPPNDRDILNPPSSEANASGGETPADPVKQVFDLGVSVLTTTGVAEKQARSLIGKWCKGGKEGEVLQALLMARSKANPIEWLNARFKTAKWVSKSGYEYRGSEQQIVKEAERRGDMDTYWSVKAAMDRRAA